MGVTHSCLWSLLFAYMAMFSCDDLELIATVSGESGIHYYIVCRMNHVDSDQRRCRMTRLFWASLFAFAYIVRCLILPSFSIEFINVKIPPISMYF